MYEVTVYVMSPMRIVLGMGRGEISRHTYRWKWQAKIMAFLRAPPMLLPTGGWFYSEIRPKLRLVANQ